MCPPGFRSDEILYVPLDPFFNEGFSENCYLHETSYIIIAVVTVCLSAVIGLLALALFLSYFRRSVRNSLMERFYLSTFVSFVIVVLIVCLSIFQATQRYVMPLLIVWGSLFGFCVFWLTQIMFKVIAKHLASLNMDGNLNSYVGGRRTQRLVRFVLYGFFSPAFMLLLLASSVLFGIQEKQLGGIFFRAWCACVAFLTFVCFALSMRVMDNYANKLMDPSMNETRKKFLRGKWMLLLAGTPAVVLWVLHATIIPVFGYIFLFHMLNQCLVLGTAIYALTTDARIKAALQLNNASNQSSHNQNDKLEQVRTQLGNPDANDAFVLIERNQSTKKFSNQIFNENNAVALLGEDFIAVKKNKREMYLASKAKIKLANDSLIIRRFPWVKQHLKQALNNRTKGVVIVFSIITVYWVLVVLLLVEAIPKPCNYLLLPFAFTEIFAFFCVFNDYILRKLIKTTFYSLRVIAIVVANGILAYNLRDERIMIIPSLVFVQLTLFSLDAVIPIYRRELIPIKVTSVLIFCVTFSILIVLSFGLVGYTDTVLNFSSEASFSFYQSARESYLITTLLMVNELYFLLWKRHRVNRFNHLYKKMKRSVLSDLSSESATATTTNEADDDPFLESADIKQLKQAKERTRIISGKYMVRAMSKPLSKFIPQSYMGGSVAYEMEQPGKPGEGAKKYYYKDEVCLFESEAIVFSVMDKSVGKKLFLKLVGTAGTALGFIPVVLMFVMLGVISIPSYSRETMVILLAFFFAVFFVCLGVVSLRRSRIALFELIFHVRVLFSLQLEVIWFVLTCLAFQDVRIVTPLTALCMIFYRATDDSDLRIKTPVSRSISIFFIALFMGVFLVLLLVNGLSQIDHLSFSVRPDLMYYNDAPYVFDLFQYLLDFTFGLFLKYFILCLHAFFSKEGGADFFLFYECPMCPAIEEDDLMKQPDSGGFTTTSKAVIHSKAVANNSKALETVASIKEVDVPSETHTM